MADPPARDDPAGGGGGLDDRVRAASADMSARLVKYLASELDVNAESYACLRAMNQATAERYRAMGDGAGLLNESMEQLSARHATLQPLLLQVRDIETHVAELERVVSQLNEYTKRLEHRYRALA
jgi:ABC-type transporter Mla subunit MlaD